MEPAGEPWFGPKNLDIDGNQLIWNTFQGGSHAIKPGRGLLSGFLRLGDAEPSDVLKFARRWGVLDLCGHGLPQSHTHLAFNLLGADWAPVCVTPTGDAGDRREDIEVWRQIASDARVILEQLAVALRRDPPRVVAPEVWRQLSWLPSVSVLEVQAMRGSDAEFQRAALAALVSNWLSVADIRPRLRWSTGQKRPEATLARPALFSALTIQLWLAVCGQQLAYQCDGDCGGVLLDQPIRRGRRNYCDECRQLNIPQRNVSRDYRQRRRHVPRADIKQVSRAARPEW